MFVVLFRLIFGVFLPPVSGSARRRSPIMRIRAYPHPLPQKLANRIPECKKIIEKIKKIPNLKFIKISTGTRILSINEYRKSFIFFFLPRYAFSICSGSWNTIYMSGLGEWDWNHSPFPAEREILFGSHYVLWIQIGKYIVFWSESGFRILDQFGSGSRSGSRAILKLWKNEIQNYFREK